MRIFLDTAPLIYFVEKERRIYQRLLHYFTNCVIHSHILQTSVLTIAEFEIKPRKLGNEQLIRSCDSLLNTLIEIRNIDIQTSKTSALLRAHYRSLKSADSLQLAAALHSDSDVFLTNDKRLKMVKEVNVKLVTDL